MLNCGRRTDRKRSGSCRDRVGQDIESDTAKCRLWIARRRRWLRAAEMRFLKVKVDVRQMGEQTIRDHVAENKRSVVGCGGNRTPDLGVSAVVGEVREHMPGSPAAKQHSIISLWSAGHRSPHQHLRCSTARGRSTPLRHHANDEHAEIGKEIRWRPRRRPRA